MPAPRRPAGPPQATGSPADAGTFPGEAIGTEEVPILNWPQLWRERLGRRVHASDRYRWWVLWTALAGMFATGFTITILGVSVGEIADDLGASEADLTWIVSGPLLALALGMPLFGKLGDVRGHRRVYLWGFGGFAVTTFLAAFAWDAGSLIGLRVVGALIGAATGPTSMALIMQAFTVEDRVKAMGWWSLVGAGAPVIGLVAGGPIVDAFGWRWLFVAQAPLSLAALALGVVVLRETPRRPRERIDVAGAAALAVGTVGLLLALDLGRRAGWSSPAPLVSLLVGVAGLGLFVPIERRAAHPLLPLALFRRRNFSASLVAQLVGNFAYMGGFIITPVLMQDEFGYSVSAAALAMLCRPLTFSLSAPLAGYVAVKTGERAASIAGSTFVVVSMACFALAASQGQEALAFVALVLSGLGLGTSSPSLVSSVANAVDADDLGVANAAQSMVASIGAAVGIQVLGAVQAAGAGASAFTAAYLLGGAVAAIGVVASGFIRSEARVAPLRVAEAA